eukprot:1662149-Rhodomonas_salina.1
MEAGAYRGVAAVAADGQTCLPWPKGSALRSLRPHRLSATFPCHQRVCVTGAAPCIPLVRISLCAPGPCDVWWSCVRAESKQRRQGRTAIESRELQCVSGGRG